MRYFLFSIVLVLSISSCKKEPDNNTSSTPKLIFKFVFDSTQTRLNNIGQISTMPLGHAGQSPLFNAMSAHYVELAPSPYTALGAGDVLYHAVENTTGGATAIDFNQSNKVGNNQTFFSIPLKDVTVGTYQYLRVSLAYQNYDVKLKINVPPLPVQQITGTVASFIGYNTYINCFNIKDSTLCVNDDKTQGFWAFETDYNVSSGQAPAGATTVVNPLFATSPIPAGSCVVTAPFAPGSLTITGNETSDVTVVVSLSTNKSFEWIDNTPDGLWEPLAGESVVDMGIRGMIPTIQ